MTSNHPSGHSPSANGTSANGTAPVGTSANRTAPTQLLNGHDLAQRPYIPPLHLLDLDAPSNPSSRRHGFLGRLGFLSAPPNGPDTSIPQPDPDKWEQQLRFIERKEPAAATRLRRTLHENVAPAYARCRDKCEEVEERRKERYRLALENNAQIDLQQAELRSQYEKDLDVPHAALLQSEEAVREANFQASLKSVQGGGFEYDPENPSVESAIGVKPRSAEETEAEMKLPHHSVMPPMPTIAWASSSIVMGSMMGVTYGFKSGALNPHNLGGDPFALTIFLAFGIGAASLAGYLLKTIWAALSEQYHLGHPVRRWWWALASGASCSLFLAAAEITTQMHGILAALSIDRTLAQLLGAPGAEPSASSTDTSAFFISSFLTLAYCGACAVHGWAKGRMRACSNRLALAVRVDREHRTQDRQKNPLVQEAMKAAVHAQALGLRHRDRAAQVEEIKQHFEADLSRLEERRLEILSGYSPEEKGEMRAFLLSWIGTCQKFEHELKAAQDA